MCITTHKFTQAGFSVTAVHNSHSTPLVEVTDIPEKHILKQHHIVTEVVNGVRRELKVGYWLGCHVAIVQNQQIQ